MFRIQRNKPDKESTVAHGVTRVKVSGIVNVFFIDVVHQQRRSWVLLDTGMPNSAKAIIYAAEQKYGANARPSCIILTHAHVDHAGSVVELVEKWDVPVYAHPLEIPYITGQSYPPRDSSIGGAMSVVSRVFPQCNCNVGLRARPLSTHPLPFENQQKGGDINSFPSGEFQPLSADKIQPFPTTTTAKGSADPSDELNENDSSDNWQIEEAELEELPGWKIYHTPGHTPGHVVLWRQLDRTLLVGDVLLTQNQDSYLSVLLELREFNRPPVYWTTDWTKAKKSIEFLASLDPYVVASGHGAPIRGGATTAQDFRRFAKAMEPPKRGRYVNTPALADESGVVSVPPPVADTTQLGWFWTFMGGMAVAATTVSSWFL